MVVRVVRVDHVHAFVTDDRAKPQRGARERARPGARGQAEPIHHLDAGFSRLGLESIAGNDPQQHAVAARAQAGHELDDGIGAAGPPAVRGQVQDRQRLHALAASNASTRWPTTSALIPRMHGWSIGHSR